MAPRRTRSAVRRPRAPCARRDGPGGRRRYGRQYGLLPKLAGMVPRPGHGRWPPATAPRTRGDGPTIAVHGIADTPCYPHVQVWVRHLAPRRRHDRLIPARAGMVPLPVPHPQGMLPGRSRSRRAKEAAPRTHGDDPNAFKGQHVLWGTLPAPAGMVSTCTSSPHRVAGAPRACGDAPLRFSNVGSAKLCSPRAGMIRGRWSSCRTKWHVPRADGDGPTYESTDQAWKRVPCAEQYLPPCTGLLAAHAGMIPSIAAS